MLSGAELFLEAISEDGGPWVRCSLVVQVSLIRIRTRRYNMYVRDPSVLQSWYDRNPETEGIKPKGTPVGKTGAPQACPSIIYFFWWGLGGRYSFSTAHVVLNLIKPHKPRAKFSHYIQEI